MENIPYTLMNHFNEIIEVIKTSSLSKSESKLIDRGMPLPDLLKEVFIIVSSLIIKPEKKDPEIVYVKTPMKIWREQQVSGESPDYAIIIGSILENLKIPYKLKMVGYRNLPFQHIYVIVPSEESERGYFVLDPQMMEFDKENTGVTSEFIK